MNTLKVINKNLILLVMITVGGTVSHIQASAAPKAKVPAKRILALPEPDPIDMVTPGAAKAKPARVVHHKTPAAPAQDANLVKLQDLASKLLDLKFIEASNIAKNIKTDAVRKAIDDLNKLIFKEYTQRKYFEGNGAPLLINDFSNMADFNTIILKGVHNSDENELRDAFLSLAQVNETGVTLKETLERVFALMSKEEKEACIKAFESLIAARYAQPAHKAKKSVAQSHAPALASGAATASQVRPKTSAEIETERHAADLTKKTAEKEREAQYYRDQAAQMKKEREEIARKTRAMKEQEAVLQMQRAQMLHQQKMEHMNQMHQMHMESQRHQSALLQTMMSAAAPLRSKTATATARTAPAQAWGAAGAMQSSSHYQSDAKLSAAEQADEAFARKLQDEENALARGHNVGYGRHAAAANPQLQQQRAKAAAAKPTMKKVPAPTAKPAATAKPMYKAVASTASATAARPKTATVADPRLEYIDSTLTDLYAEKERLQNLIRRTPGGALAVTNGTKPLENVKAKILEYERIRQLMLQPADTQPYVAPTASATAARPKTAATARAKTPAPAKAQPAAKQVYTAAKPQLKAYAHGVRQQTSEEVQLSYKVQQKLLQLPGLDSAKLMHLPKKLGNAQFMANVTLISGLLTQALAKQHDPILEAFNKLFLVMISRNSTEINKALHLIDKMPKEQAMEGALFISQLLGSMDLDKLTALNQVLTTILE